MIINDNDKISSFQNYVLLISVMVGIGIMFMTSGVAKNAGQAGWLAVLNGGAIYVLVSLLSFKVTM